MLESLLEAGSERETRLFYGVRNEREHLMRERLARLAERHENVHVPVRYSRPSPGDAHACERRILRVDGFRYALVREVLLASLHPLAGGSSAGDSTSPATNSVPSRPTEQRAR